MSWSVVRRIAGIQEGEPPRREEQLHPACQNLSQLTCERERRVPHRTVSAWRGLPESPSLFMPPDVVLKRSGPAASPT
jgi:hypothetical protein